MFILCLQNRTNSSWLFVKFNVLSLDVFVPEYDSNTVLVALYVHSIVIINYSVCGLPVLLSFFFRKRQK